MVRDPACGRGPPSGRRDRHGLEGGDVDVAVDGADNRDVVLRAVGAAINLKNI